MTRVEAVLESVVRLEVWFGFWNMWPAHHPTLNRLVRAWHGHQGWEYVFHIFLRKCAVSALLFYYKLASKTTSNQANRFLEGFHC